MRNRIDDIISEIQRLERNAEALTDKVRAIRRGCELEELSQAIHRLYEAKDLIRSARSILSRIGP